MKQKKYIVAVILLVTYAHLYTNVQPIISGEGFYGIVSRIGTSMDQANSGISTIETQLQSISGSTIDTLSSVVENLGSNIDTLVDNTNTLSAQDVLIYNTTTQIDAKVDNLTVAVNNMSVQDTLIYNTVTEIDTKVDTLNTKVNTISAQNVLLYNLESVIDSKVDEIRSFPDFVQAPTAFQSQGINAKTSRYFFTKRTIGLNATEKQVFSFRNDSVSTVVRISAVGCGLDLSLGAGSGNAISTWVSLYKNATLSLESFSSFDPSSVLSINTAGTFTGGTQVYELQAGITADGAPRAFEYLPKELYSVIIAPGEILTVAAGMGTSTGDTSSIIIMWEEIINY